MRRAATDADLEKIPVSADEEATLKRRMLLIVERLERLELARSAVTGMAMLRLGCQAASILGLPYEDMGRFVSYASEVFEARQTLRLPTDAELGGLNELTVRLVGVCNCALQGEDVDDYDKLAIQLMVGVSLLRYAGHDDAMVGLLFGATWGDAENATARYAARAEAKA